MCRTTNLGFKDRHGDVISDDGYKFDDNYNLSLLDCQVRWEHNCSCIAYASINDNGTGCEFWGQSIYFRARDTYGRQIYLLVSRKGGSRKEEILLSEEGS